MSLLTVVLVLIAVGVLLGLVRGPNPTIPMDPTIRNIIVVVVIVCVVIWLLQVFGLIGAINEVRVPRLN